MKHPEFRIYPSIGVARLGNGPANKESVVFSPEVPWDNLYETNQDYLTDKGEIKKQAQRFYVYHCDENGVPVKKVDPKEYDIEWRAEVANKKAFWYNFSNCLDLSIRSDNRNVSPAFAENRLAPGISVSQRNPNILRSRTKADEDYRRDLVNKPARTKVRHADPKKPLKGYFPFAHDNSKTSKLAKPIAGNHNKQQQLPEHQSARVDLGSLEYDDGALIFYAADGKSASLNPSDLNTNFADNSNWYDDICDGRITATLISKLDGSKIKLNDARSAAWVITAPPDYAPQIQPISTMYDLVVGASKETFDPELSLVFPMLYRLYRMQWVNLGDFLSPSFKETIDRLTEEGNFQYLYKDEPAATARGVREQVFNLFRNPAYTGLNEPIIPSSATTSIAQPGSKDPLKLPSYPGDGVNYPGSPAQWFAIPPLLYQALEQWRDCKGASIKGKEFDDIDKLGEYFQEKFQDAAKDQSKAPLLMTRAVLETLYGGGFHPGVELTWPMRHNLIYAENEEVFKSVAQDTGLFGLREVRINSATHKEQEEIFFNDFGLQMESKDIEESMNTHHEKHWLWKITPGDLTKWMGIPWQSDAGSCQAVFIEKQYPVPAWWAANLPVDVLPQESFHQLLDEDVLPKTKEHIYASRLPWLRTADTGFVGYHATGGYTNGLISMVYQWDKIGMVTGREIQPPVRGIPEIVYVAFYGPKAEDD